MSGSRKGGGGALLDEFVRVKHYEYQQLSSSVLLFVRPLNNSLLFQFPQKRKSALYFLHLLGLTSR